MSEEHDVHVVKLVGITKHENADSLSIVEVQGRPVIFNTVNFNEGDLAVYVPVDSILPDEEKWSWVGNKTQGGYRVRAKRLRGVFSMGILCPAEPEWKEGDDVKEALGITDYNEEVHLTFGNSIKDPGFMPVYNIESYRKYKHSFNKHASGEVVITEKIHGANARFLYKNDTFYAGSRTQYKEDTEKCIWWVAARDNNLAEKLKKYPDIAVYGEVYGQVQDLKYGVATGIKFAAFDAYDTNKGIYLDYDDFAAMMKDLEIDCVPVLYRGLNPFIHETEVSNPEVLAEGKSILSASISEKNVCIREGFVIRPVKEAFSHKMHRVIAKLVGQDYLTRKQK